MNSRRQALRCLAALPAIAFGAADVPNDPIDAAIRRIKPLFKPKTPPQPGDWLLQHAEPGQSYVQFRALMPTRAADRYSTLRIVPIGTLSKGQLAVFGIVKDFLEPFFGLALVVSAPVDLAEIPQSAQNRQTLDGQPQLLTTYLLQKVLLSRRGPSDAAVLGLTAHDLWPGPGWNFVFGQSSLTERVGVWSMARNGDADGSATARTLCALRTVMTATHETGHMFGIRHCIAYQCGMNGSNNSDERDRQPLEFCPECQPKLWWTCKLDPLKRSDAIVSVARKHGFSRLAGNLQAQSNALRSR
jgi:archaemetzincin